MNSRDRSWPGLVLGLALSLFGVRAEAQVIPVQQAGWPQTANDSAFGQLAGDGGWQAIVYGWPVAITVVNPDGTPWANWSQFSSPSGSSMYFWQHTKFGDLDGDGVPEVVVPRSSGNGIFAFKADGSLLPGWGPLIPGLYSSEANHWNCLADLDGDGAMELVAGALMTEPTAITPATTGVCVYRADGTLLDGWPQSVGDRSVSGVAVGDLEFDGTLDVVVTTIDWANGSWQSSPVFVFRNDGTLRPGWPKIPTLAGIGSIGCMKHPRIADLDGDGVCEIIGTFANVLHVISPQGVELATRVLLIGTGEGVNMPSGIGDVDGDGLPEVVTVGHNKMTVYKHGQPGFAASFTTTGLFSGVSIADVDGDGAAEIAARMTYDMDHVYLFNGSLQPLPGWPVSFIHSSGPNRLGHTEFLDVDGDGDLEFMWSAIDDSGAGWSYLADLPNPGTEPGRVDWSGLHGKPTGSAFYHEGLPQHRFVRGDANGDGHVGMVDLVALISHLFLDGPASCQAALDTNRDGVVNLIDALRLAYALFGMATVPHPFPRCGISGAAYDTPGCEQPLTLSACPP